MYGDNPLSVRRLVALFKYLPADAAVYVTRDPEGAMQSRWSTDTQLLATVSEQLDVLTRISYAAAAHKKPNWPAVRHKRPALPFSEPVQKRRRQANAAETVAILRGEL